MLGRIDCVAHHVFWLWNLGSELQFFHNAKKDQFKKKTFLPVIFSLFLQNTTGKLNEIVVKSRHSDVATYQSPEIYVDTYPVAMPMKPYVMSPKKEDGSGAIYSTNTGSAVIYSRLDDSRAATYPTKSINDSLFTKPWHSRPELFPEKHPLKLLQDFNDNSLKTLSQPQGVKQPVISPTVPHRTSMSSPVKNITSQGE